MSIIDIANNVNIKYIYIFESNLVHIKKARKVLKNSNRNLTLYGSSLYNFIVA